MVLTASSIIGDKIKLKNFKLLNTTKNKQENISKYFGKKRDTHNFYVQSLPVCCSSY